MTEKKSILMGSDHAGFPLKQIVGEFLKTSGYEVIDLGTDGVASVNYVDYGKKVAKAVSLGQADKGILVCGTGMGMSIVANRFSGVRAALCSDVFSAQMSRMHNDSNILVMGGRLIGDILACEIVRVWLATPFEGGRHLERILSIDTAANSGAEK